MVVLAQRCTGGRGARGTSGLSSDWVGQAASRPNRWDRPPSEDGLFCLVYSNANCADHEQQALPCRSTTRSTVAASPLAPCPRSRFVTSAACVASVYSPVPLAYAAPPRLTTLSGPVRFLSCPSRTFPQLLLDAEGIDSYDQTNDYSNHVGRVLAVGVRYGMCT